MKIQSTRFKTELEFDDKKVINMPWGLPGFPESKRFCILEMEDPESPFKWLHDIDNTNIALLITDPYLFFPEYNPEINEAVLEELGVAKVETDLTIFTIVKVTPGGSDAYTNLRAPVAVNTQTLQARQIILESDEYSVKTSLFAAKAAQKHAANE